MTKVRMTGRGRRRDSRPDCVFCQIVAGQAPGSTVFEDGRMLAFMDTSHFHLIPIHRDRSPLRREGRRVTLEFVQQPASPAALDRIARRIRGHLAGARSPGGASPLCDGGRPC